MDVPPIDSLLSRIPRSLGSHAPVLAEIEAALADPETSLGAVAGAIEKDPDLTARLLRLGNSSYYGFPRRLSALAETIGLIGIHQVQDLILASSIVAAFSGLSPEYVNMESFWRHSLSCGIAARTLAMERRMPKADRYFVAGLLHDLGRLVLFSQAPQVAQAIFQLCQRERILMRDAEAKVLGYDHTQIGEALVQLWQYPPNLVAAVGHHHHPMSAEPYRLEAAVVHVADHLVNAMELGSSGEHHVPPLNAEAWNEMRLPTESLSSVEEALDNQLEAVEQAFLFQSSPAKA